jgi:hypothetical protein
MMDTSPALAESLSPAAIVTAPEATSESPLVIRMAPLEAAVDIVIRLAAPVPCKVSTEVASRWNTLSPATIDIDPPKLPLPAVSDTDPAGTDSL